MRRIFDPGTWLFLVGLVALLVPQQWLAWGLYGLGGVLVFTFLFLMALARPTRPDPNTPSWARAALEVPTGRLSRFLRNNLILVIIGLAVLWQFYPLWSAA